MEELIINELTSPKRQIKVKVSLYSGDTLTADYTEANAVKEVKIERVGESSKFFGYGICQKLTVVLLDRERNITLNKGDKLKVLFGTALIEYKTVFPSFYIEDIKRDENTNNITITAYDTLYNTTDIKIKEVSIPETPYNIDELTNSIVSHLELTAKRFTNLYDADNNGFYDEAEEYNLFHKHEHGGNFNGEESLREVLNAIAEATGTIYFLDNNNILVFRRLNRNNPELDITKSNYFTLTSKDKRKLDEIVKITELGNNVRVGNYNIDATQYIRNNPFWEFDENSDCILDCFDKVGSLTITPFVCEWRGNPYLKIGDLIRLTAKDDTTFNTYVLNDVIIYTGGLKQTTQWDYKDGETAKANPATIGETIKETYAFVDKVNQRIDLVVSSVNANTSEIATLALTTEDITAEVNSIKEYNGEAIEDINEDIANIKNSVEAKISSEDVKILVKEEIDDGVNKVSTGKGFTFDDSGLTIEDLSSNNVNIKTTVSNNGMKVYADGKEVLTANDGGVKAKDLHATTYLIIGKNSRFEDYGTSRTGCFWIGE